MTDRDDPVTGHRFASALKTLLTIAFVVAGIVYVAANFEEFRGLSWPSVHAIAAVAIGFVASVGFRSLFNYYAARRLGADLALSESFMLSAIVTASNSLLPANAGAAFRAWYMKRVHALPLGYFASTTMLSFLVTTLLMSLVAMLLLALIHRELGYFRLDLFIALPLIAAVMMIGLLLRAKPSGEREPETSVWHSFRSGYFQLVGDTRLVALSLLIVSLNFVVAAIVWVIVIHDTAPGIDILEASLFAAAQIVSGLITLTPGAAGFQELVGLYVGRSFEITVVELFAILIWVRAVRILAAIALAAPFAVILRLRSARSSD
jgi:uncharacterized membrane protein YbhN (UPF0104 family)